MGRTIEESGFDFQQTEFPHRDETRSRFNPLSYPRDKAAGV
jgi:hypothetical protein